MRTKRNEVWWGVGSVALVVAVIAAMVVLTRVAWSVSTAVRRQIAAPGPPVKRGDLARVMGDVPVAPSLNLDEMATNDARTRLLIGMMQRGGRERRVLVFASSQSYGAVTSWYNQRLSGWSPVRRASARQDSETRIMTWMRPRPGRATDRVSLVQMPQIPDRILMVISVPPPSSPRPPAPK